MIISGTLLPSRESQPSPYPLSGLEVGNVLTGRVVQLGVGGRGLLRFADGSSFTFANGPTMKPGEAVQVQVLRLAPEIAFRLLTSSSGVAASLAESVEQSLVRAPDIFANLLNWSGMATGDKSTGAAAALLSEAGSLFALKAGITADTLVTRQGLTLAQVLQKSLPNISAQGLLRGDMSELVRLLEDGSRQDVRQVIRQLRQVAADLFRPSEAGSEKSLAGQGSASQGENSAELSAVRNSLQRLGDLLAMQEILPRTSLSLDGGQLLGYRLFWLTEGGMGEAIWQRERQRQRRQRDSDAETSVTSVLLSLNMTGLGAVQARIAYGGGLCSIGIAAEEEESLTALRWRIGELRQALLAAELPLGSLDLSRLRPGEMKKKRMHSLGLDSNFYTEA